MRIVYRGSQCPPFRSTFAINRLSVTPLESLNLYSLSRSITWSNGSRQFCVSKFKSCKGLDFLRKLKKKRQETKTRLIKYIINYLKEFSSNICEISISESFYSLYTLHTTSRRRNWWTKGRENFLHGGKFRANRRNATGARLKMCRVAAPSLWSIVWYFILGKRGAEREGAKRAVNSTIKEWASMGIGLSIRF